jgi:hypothetical protein
MSQSKQERNEKVNVRGIRQYSCKNCPVLCFEIHHLKNNVNSQQRHSVKKNGEQVRVSLYVLMLKLHIVTSFCRFKSKDGFYTYERIILPKI